jgi:hypothetical protein
MLFDISKYCYNSEEEEKNTASVTENVYRSNYLNLNSKGQFFNTTFNNISVISWRSVLLVEETGVSEENHRPVAIH